MTLSVGFPGCAFGLGALATLLMACSGSREAAEPGQPSTVQLDPFAPDASVVCSVMTGEGGNPEPELYMLAPMNRKLQRYADFTAGAGIQSVTDCASARLYMDAYYRYAFEHPDFDADEELGPVVEDGAPFPNVAPAAGESMKIFAGIPVQNNPVVEISFKVTTLGTTPDPVWGDVRGKRSICTGTLISKHWILTAAHCITSSAVDDCVARNTPLEQCRPRWANWSDWRIVGTRGAQGAATKYQEDLMFRAYVHPSWSGRTLRENHEFCLDDTPFCEAVRQIGAQHDLALLYVPYQYDDVMPPSVEDDGAARLSIAPPSADWDLIGYGWGDPEVNGGSVLRGTLAPLSFGFTENTIAGTVTRADASMLCHGDSGGPLMRANLDVVTNRGAKRIEALAGILVKGAAACSAPPALNKVVAYWSRVDSPQNRKFIEGVQSRWPFAGSIVCTQRQVEGDPPPPVGPIASVEECWGKPCTSQTCEKNFTCWEPGSALTRAGKTCKVCPNGDCSCIVGQCLSTL